MPQRIGDAFHCRFARTDRRSVVVDAVTHARPAVVAALFDDVDFVAAHGAVLLLPQFSISGIEGKAFCVAEAVGPDFRQRALLAEKGIVGRRCAFGWEAHGLACWGTQIVLELLW